MLRLIIIIRMSRTFLAKTDQDASSPDKWKNQLAGFTVAQHGRHEMGAVDWGAFTCKADRGGAAIRIELQCLRIV